MLETESLVGNECLRQKVRLGMSVRKKVRLVMSV